MKSRENLKHPFLALCFGICRTLFPLTILQMRRTRWADEMVTRARVKASRFGGRTMRRGVKAFGNWRADRVLDPGRGRTNWPALGLRPR